MKLLHDDEGSNLIEFSLVVIPLLCVVFLTINIAWGVFAKASLEWAVRQGVRYAVTGQTMAGMGQDASIKNVVQTNAFGFLTGGTGIGEILINYYDPATQLATQSNAGGNIVQVSVSGVPILPLVPFLPSDSPMSLTAISSDVMEGSPGGVPPQR